MIFFPLLLLLLLLLLSTNIKIKYPRYRPTWPRGVQECKAPKFLDTRHMKVVRSSPLRTGRLYPREYPGTHFLEAESTPGTWTCLMLRKKSPVTRPGIDPGTFRLVAQRLNHYATPCSPTYKVTFNLGKIIKKATQIICPNYLS